MKLCQPKCSDDVRGIENDGRGEITSNSHSKCVRSLYHNRPPDSLLCFVLVFVSPFSNLTTLPPSLSLVILLRNDASPLSPCFFHSFFLRIHPIYYLCIHEHMNTYTLSSIVVCLQSIEGLDWVFVHTMLQPAPTRSSHTTTNGGVTSDGDLLK